MCVCVWVCDYDKQKTKKKNSFTTNLNTKSFAINVHASISNIESRVCELIRTWTNLKR